MARRRDANLVDRIGRIIADVAFTTVFQPIVELRTDRVVGFEALTRFLDDTPPERRFAQAAGLGLGVELETSAVRLALVAAADLPCDAWVSLNVSPAAITAQEPLASLVRMSPRPVVLELTEHVPIEDHQSVRGAIGTFGPAVRVAIDDAGAGFASFRHIVELRPAFVKLNADFVRSVDGDDARQAFIAGLVYFANRTGCALVAEGIETVEERDTLRSIGVDLGQGFWLGRPAPVSEFGPVAVASRRVIGG